jgi:hypothetical protein
MKKELIFKNPNTKIKVSKDYIQFNSNGLPLLLSYKHINNVYINKSIKILLNDLYRLSQKVPVYIIDHNGYILSSIKKED